MATVATGQRATDIKSALKNPPDLEAVSRLSKDPMDNSLMHTTCVATRLNGGHANNALPQSAQANVNCRILPGHSLEETRLALEKAVADPKIKVQFRENNNQLMDHGSDRHSYVPPAPRKEVFDPLEKIVAKMWPGIPVLPNMSTGASDGVYTNAAGMPTYCVSGEQYDRDDIRAHGKDERMGVEAFARGVDFYYSFLKGVTAEGRNIPKKFAAAPQRESNFWLRRTGVGLVSPANLLCSTKTMRWSLWTNRRASWRSRFPDPPL